MWTKLQDAGIDVSVYGVPKSLPSTHPPKQADVALISLDDDADIEILTPATTPKNCASALADVPTMAAVQSVVQFIVDHVSASGPNVSSPPKNVVKETSDPEVKDTIQMYVRLRTVKSP